MVGLRKSQYHIIYCLQIINFSLKILPLLYLYTLEVTMHCQLIIDLKKALDSVNRKILLNKLRCIGVSVKYKCSLIVIL